MSDERRIEVEVEVPATPEEAWEAIATGPGITAWFMPAEVEGRVGGSVVHHHEAELSWTGRITAYDAPRRFAYEEREPVSGAAGDDVVATEFLVEARSGGSCVVRVVMSGFGDDEAWDAAIESFTAGWRQALLSLRLYLANFRGEPVASIAAGGMVAGARDAVWSRLVEELGLPERPRTGQRVSTGAAGAPLLAGTVEQSAERMLTLLLDEPARGIGFVGAGGPGEEVFAFVRAQLFGPAAAALAAREQEAWKAWFSQRLAGAADR